MWEMGDQFHPWPSTGCRLGPALTRLGTPTKPWGTRPRDQFYFRQLDTNATAEEGLVRYLPIQHSGLKLRKAIATIPEHDLYTQ